MMEGAGMVVEDSMSNLTSGSNDASISSGNKQEIGAVSVYSQQQPPRASSSTNQSTQLASKKKRNLPGNPDPEAEVIALSPRTLLATNRFICEICNKGFQRDQNLQLHRRGHNLPWKLKQRSNKEVVRKKVYICPETTCVHHDPSRALGDLTGVKKHFSRKHGEKKWKCEKCSKRYAVRSDWKAHSKICGTREYRCDCGTLFSRRDSFITHRAFCDALAEESARAISSDNPLGLGTTTTPSSIQPHLQNHQLLHGSVFPLKREQDQLHLHLQQGFNNMTLPPWLSTAPPDLFSPRLEDQPTIHHHQENANSLNHNPTLSSSFQDASSASPHMSATALLQKAAQMGSVTASKTSCQSAAAGEAAAATTAMLLRPHQAAAHHMISTTAAATAAAGLLMSSSREDQMGSFMHHNHQGLMASFATGCMERQQQQVGAGNPTKTTNDDDHHHGGGDLMGMVNSHHGFEGSSCSYGGDYENFEGMLENSGKDNSGKDQGGGVAVDGRGINNINDGFTRDFLGLRAFPPPPRQFLNLDDLHQIGGLSFNHQHNHHNPPAQW